jgi:hypothetical protein
VTDLIERLRSAAYALPGEYPADGSGPVNVCTEAADELERRAPVRWLSNPPGAARWWFDEAASFGRWRPSFRSMWIRSARQIALT